MDNVFRTRQEEKRSGVEERQESGVEENQESGVEENQESGVEENQESGVEERQESGVEERQESGVEENQESGEKENQESGEKEKTAQETLTRSPQASHDPAGSWLSKMMRRQKQVTLKQDFSGATPNLLNSLPLAMKKLSSPQAFKNEP
ncbi:hypothetical protein NDU88_003270 [Pleurodeles waltl]|uniref:Uncharacterized protein n=1 Tax=Pleurodeles waltl TaxID=8319 RepID=A0AAV7W4U5_PLEWA|nr:hypothetical protein NDU88_003270 [Pleurodeles waltl]